MILISAEIKLFSAFGINHVHQSSSFQKVSNFQISPYQIKSAVSEADFSEMLCSLHDCYTWTWKVAGWILDILRNHTIPKKAAKLQTLVHFLCPNTI